MIAIKNDIDIDIATAHSRLSKRWKNQRTKWSALLNRCSETKRTDETAAEYNRMRKDEQSNVKDVGGFVGGYLSNGARKTTNLMYRTMATLDIDYGTADVWDDFGIIYNFAAMLYSTHKHTKEHPRYRLVIPFNRQVTPTEYEPICRKIADGLGINLFDDTTYEVARLFYYPSTSKDASFEFEYQDGPICNVDSILSDYKNPNDISEWPMSSREGDIVLHEMKKAGDPTEKSGLIGAFCRCYSISEAIDKFLTDVYEPTATEGRYTYIKGSVAGGLVCYDDKFAYSHHETDPCSKQLCNAFDLVRIHKYGIQDEDTKITDNTKRPSYLSMLDFISKDKKVREIMARERIESSKRDFDGISTGNDNAGNTDANTEWMQDLEYSKSGKIQNNINNVLTILENDPKLKGHLWHDLFSGMDLVSAGLPWNKEATQWGDKDDANLRVYMEHEYDITGRDKIKDAKDHVFTTHRKHPIRDYLSGLKWDGTPRLDTMIIDYIGAEDTTLIRAMTRKQFTAAVARVFNPGCKYDYCLILQGMEGIGKSTLLSIMGGEWFNDSITTTEGKEGMEQLRCAWIVELAELTSMKRSDVETVKNYLSRQEDVFRAAYGVSTQKHPRQVVFFGTTNEEHFLKGDTGNRRFWVVPLDKDLKRMPNKECRKKLIENRDQLWAEAVVRFKSGEKLYLDDDLEAEAKRVQANFNDNSDDPLENMLTMFLNTKLPTDWNTWDLQRRRAYFANPDPLEEAGVVERDIFCIPEFLCEYMGKNIMDKEYKYLSRKIGKILNDYNGWEKRGAAGGLSKKLYGKQHQYWKKEMATEDKDII